jgi:hypothetical protein
MNRREFSRLVVMAVTAQAISAATAIPLDASAKSRLFRIAATSGNWSLREAGAGRIATRSRPK